MWRWWSNNYDDEYLAKRAKHLTTQAKVPHRWDLVHDEIGYNYRMPNLNAALLCAQLEQLDSYIANKRELAQRYIDFFDDDELKFMAEPSETKSNYWLCAVLLKDKKTRNQFLEYTNDNGVMTRPVWALSNSLEMFKDSLTDDLTNSKWLVDRLVNIPSSVRIDE